MRRHTTPPTCYQKYLAAGLSNLKGTAVPLHTHLSAGDLHKVHTQGWLTQLYTSGFRV